ncbi:MAG: TRAP transporter substrate-binding protein [Rhodobacteraceae bacterium]|nr:TRAP transporter substrate-binding protein [Paracoccaceae bacterium]
MSKMTTRLLGTAAAFGLAAMTVTAADAQDRIRWQVPMAFPSTLAGLADAMPWMADQMRAVTDGQIDLRVAEPGTVIPPLAVFEAVGDGNLDAAYSWMGYELGTLPSAALFGATPFGLESTEYLAWLYFHGGRELMAEAYEPFNIHMIPCGSISPEGAGWYRFELQDVSDLQGLNFRAAGLGGEIMTELGMSVTVIAGGEIYQALETGRIDAAEFSLPSSDKQLGFHQVADYYYLPGWHQPGTNQALYVNMDSWNSLSPQTQALFEMSCMAANAYAIAKAEAMQGETLAFFEEAGVNIRTYSDEFIAAFREAHHTVMERRSANDELFARIYNSMMEFQALNRPWKEQGYLPRDWQTRIGE